MCQKSLRHSPSHAWGHIGYEVVQIKNAYFQILDYDNQRNETFTSFYLEWYCQFKL